MSEEKSGQWLSQGDVAGRLRLLRYGLIVAVVVVFLVTWLVPYVFLSAYTGEIIRTAQSAGIENTPAPFGLGDSLGWALIAGVVTAIIAVIVYFVYREVLKRTVGGA